MVCHTPFGGVEIHTKVSEYTMGVKRLTVSDLERNDLESYDLETRRLRREVAWSLRRMTICAILHQGRVPTRQIATPCIW